MPDRTAELKLHSLDDGRLAQASPARAGTLRVLRDAYLKQETPDETAFVSGFISHCVIVRDPVPIDGVLHGRRLTYGEAAILPQADREAMRSILAQALGLPFGAGRSRDDKAFVEAVGAAGWLEDMPEPAGILGVLARAADAWDGLGARLHHTIRGMDPVEVAERVNQGVRESLDEWQRELDEVRKQPLFFVVADLPVSAVRDLLFVRPEAIETMVSARVMADEEVVLAARVAVEQAPHLTEAQREDLRRGLQAVSAGDSLACRHLLPGLEGALWLSASERGVVDNQRRLLQSRRPQRMHVNGVGTLLRPDGGLQVGSDLAVFLLGAVFNDLGNDVRHGRARDGHQTSSVWSFVGLLGWLDRFAGSELMAAVTRRLVADGGSAKRAPADSS